MNVRRWAEGVWGKGGLLVRALVCFFSLPGTPATPTLRAARDDVWTKLGSCPELRQPNCCIGAVATLYDRSLKSRLVARSLLLTLILSLRICLIYPARLVRCTKHAKYMSCLRQCHFSPSAAVVSSRLVLFRLDSIRSIDRLVCCCCAGEQAPRRVGPVPTRQRAGGAGGRGQGGRVDAAPAD